MQSIFRAFSSPKCVRVRTQLGELPALSQAPLLVGGGLAAPPKNPTPAPGLSPQFSALPTQIFGYVCGQNAKRDLYGAVTSKSHSTESESSGSESESLNIRTWVRLESIAGFEYYMTRGQTTAAARPNFWRLKYIRVQFDTRLRHWTNRLTRWLILNKLFSRSKYATHFPDRAQIRMPEKYCKIYGVILIGNENMKGRNESAVYS